jgi:hypothetical protein
MNLTLARKSVALRASSKLGLLCLLTLAVIIPCRPLLAQNKTLKDGLDQALVGQSVVSNIVIGGKAVPRGVQTDYPVNTVVSPDVRSPIASSGDSSAPTLALGI